MKFAVIAAGEGSRLAQEGVAQPKPLVPVCGEPMIDRLMRVFVECGATEIVVIVNEWSTAVREHLQTLELPVPLKMVVKTTPSSMHSFHALSPYLRGERFCLTTVDTIFREEEFKKYIRYFINAKEDVDGCMAVTPFVDDEKPLWVGVAECNDAEATNNLDKQGTHRLPIVTGFHDQQEGDDHLISGGIYCLGDKALDVLDHCMEQGMSRMRNFQRQLVAEGLNIEAYPIDKILDVDHKNDIAKAEAFLRPLKDKKLIGISRGNAYSPNCVDNDDAIIGAVKLQLEALGAQVEMKSENVRNFSQFDGWTRDQVELFLRREREKKNLDGYFSMARSANSLTYLGYLDIIGLPGVNTSVGVINCIRETMTQVFLEEGIPCPRSMVLNFGDKLPDEVTFPCWLKRGDGCAQQKEDTCYAETPQVASEVLADFWARKVLSVVINEHLRGDLVKFYGVEGTDFFYWFYPSKCGHRSKFGLEAINGDAQGFRFDVDALKNTTDRAAKLLNVPVYGGDCIIAEDGTFKIIDFNDWPSFAPCRDEAAYYIAKRICQEVLK